MIYIRKSFQYNLNFGAKKETFEQAKELRKTETPTEKILWQVLRDRRFNGYKFRRQHPVKQFIIDFYCPKYWLGIELDGDIHKNKEVKEHDINRQAEIENFGITLLRFKNLEIENDIEGVLNKIELKISELSNTKK